MARARISRFTINLATKKLELDSEVVIFEYDSQICSCCHRGGGMALRLRGQPLRHRRVTRTRRRAPTATRATTSPSAARRVDPTQATNTHCGAEQRLVQRRAPDRGQHERLQRQDAALQPDRATLADGAKPAIGVGTTYSLPTAASPNGPNLFDGTEGGGGKTKPEIYAMGLRNPSRMTIDPETDVPYAAWVGPDAGAPSATQGPSTYETATQLPTAGNYGWPYCMGNQQAYRDRIADGSLRTTNVAGYVSGGPAASPTNGWYDCKNLVNDSTEQHRPRRPCRTPRARARTPARRAPTNVWYSRGNPNNANGCPQFPRPSRAPTTPRTTAPRRRSCART